MRRLACVVALTSLVACDLVLGLPDGSRSVDELESRLCSCPLITDQGTEFGVQCAEGVQSKTDPEKVDLVTEGCTECKNAASCYAQVVDETEAGAPCATHLECETFACAMVAIDAAVVGEPVISSVCAASCASCGSLLEGEISFDLAPCVDAPLIPLVDCVCSAAEGTDLLQCGCAGMPSLFGTGQCRFEEVACRECLLQRFGDDCASQQNACLGHAARPLGS